MIKFTFSLNPGPLPSRHSFMGNYRPISIVTGFAKIFEMVIFKRLNDQFAMHKILSPQQYGFQKGLSTADVIFNLTHVILSVE
jgi:hypothetical protein